MSTDSLPFPLSPIADIIEDVRQGRMVILVDASDRENEGDLIIPAHYADAAAINFMARFGRGLICLALAPSKIKPLGLPMMTPANRSLRHTAFTVSIDAARGISTGISAADRAHTIAAAIAPGARKADLVSPGHVFPLAARAGGVLARPGHTEAAVDIARLAGLDPSAAICEIMADDGTMARLPELCDYAKRHGLKIASISDLIAFREKHDPFMPDQRSDSLCILLVVSRYYEEIAAELEAGAREALNQAGAVVETIEAEGAFDIPTAITIASRSGRYDGYVALGAVIRGQTSHYDIICTECARGVMEIGLMGVPVGFGVLTCDTKEQAMKRADRNGANKGYQAARACLQLCHLDCPPPPTGE